MERSRRADIRRKNVYVDQAKLDRAVQILAARSETEAIDQALSLLAFRHDLVEGIQRIGASGGVEDVS